MRSATTEEEEQMDDELCPICQESQCCGSSLTHDLNHMKELISWIYRHHRLAIQHHANNAIGQWCSDTENKIDDIRKISE